LTVVFYFRVASARPLIQINGPHFHIKNKPKRLLTAIKFWHSKARTWWRCKRRLFSLFYWKCGFRFKSKPGWRKWKLYVGSYYEERARVYL